MWGDKTVAVIIPNRDGQSRLDVIYEFDSTGYVDEVVLVGNVTQPAVKNDHLQTRVKFLEQKESGLGQAIRDGLNKTKADLLIVAEGDGSFKGKDILKLLSYSDDFDVVFGSRTHLPLIEKRSGMTFFRRIVNDAYGKLISILFLSSPLTDVACTLRLTNRKAWEKVSRQCRSRDEIFLTEWLLSVVKNRIRFIEIPVHFVAPKKRIRKKPFFYYFKGALKILIYILRARVVNSK